jgi:hypothetical protein
MQQQLVRSDPDPKVRAFHRVGPTRNWAQWFG